MNSRLRDLTKSNSSDVKVDLTAIKTPTPRKGTIIHVCGSLLHFVYLRTSEPQPQKLSCPLKLNQLRFIVCLANFYLYTKNIVATLLFLPTKRTKQSRPHL